MAKREIERALKRKGIRPEELEWEQAVTPEEMVPTWRLEISEADADRFGLFETHFFDNTEHALREIEEWEPVDEPVV